MCFFFKCLSYNTKNCPASIKITVPKSETPIKEIEKKKSKKDSKNEKKPNEVLTENNEKSQIDDIETLSKSLIEPIKSNIKV